jgi:AcrR family transcriptional regulator
VGKPRSAREAEDAGGQSRTFTESARRAQIVAAAIDVIADGGYASASFAAIARRAGLSSTGLISYHFASKEILRAGQSAGEFREFDTRVMAAVIQRAVDGIAFLLETHPGIDPGAYADELVTTFTLANRSAP